MALLPGSHFAAAFRTSHSQNITYIIMYPFVARSAPWAHWPHEGRPRASSFPGMKAGSTGQGDTAHSSTDEGPFKQRAWILLGHAAGLSLLTSERSGDMLPNIAGASLKAKAHCGTGARCRAGLDRPSAGCKPGSGFQASKNASASAKSAA